MSCASAVRAGRDCRSRRGIVWGCAWGCLSERIGPVAQWLEPTAHNGLVGGSNPPGPTIFNAFRVRTLSIVRECSLSVHEYHWSIVGQPGGTPRSGRGGRRFKSCHSDQLSHYRNESGGLIWGTKPRPLFGPERESGVGTPPTRIDAARRLLTLAAQASSRHARGSILKRIAR